MSQVSGNDPLFHALDELVRAGQLPPDRARAALEAGRGGPVAAPPAPRGPLFGLPAFRPAGPLAAQDVAVALGVALLATVVSLSTAYSRKDGDLDWSNYTVGLLATAGLLAVVGCAWQLVREPARRDALVAWPGAFGAVAVGLMIGLAMDDDDLSGYVAGLAVVALSVGGYALVRRGAFVVSAIAGLLVAWLNLFDDSVGLEGTDGDDLGLTISAAITLFVLLVTAIGWFLPTRDLSGVVVGALAVAGHLVLLVVLVLVAVFLGALSSLGEDDGGPSTSPYHDDAWFVLGATALLVTLWLLASWLTGHAGFRVLAVAMPVLNVPLATLVLAVDHPTWWGALLGLAGGAVLGAVAVRTVGGLPGRSGGPGGPGGPGAPYGPGGPGPVHQPAGR